MWLERRIFTLRAARHIVAISARGKAEIERLYRTPASSVTVVYNGVDLARFHPEQPCHYMARGERFIYFPCR